MFLPIWLLIVINFHSTIASSRENLIEFSPLLKLQDNQKLKRTFYVQPDAENNIAGRVEFDDGSSTENSELKVTLLRYGQEVKTTTTRTGEFKFEEFTPDQTGKTYTLIAKGKNGFLAYALHVRSKFDILERNTLVEPQKQAQYVSLVEPQDQVPVLELSLIHI